MAWLHQDRKQLQKLGEKAPWSVRWIDPTTGKRREKKVGSHSMAQKSARKLEGQIASGAYEDTTIKRWAEFIEEYRKKILAGAEPGTRDQMEFAIRHFERICKPDRMKGITTKTFADYVAKRRQEPRRKGGRPVSVCTVNKELRGLRAIVRKAYRWGYLTRIPGIEFLREPQRLPTYIAPEQFNALYAAADSARLPNDLPYPASEWWRGLLVFLYMTGWRIGAALALRREDLDLEKAVAIGRAEDNKGKRDQLIPLHPLVVDHLKKVPSLSPMVFPWSQSRRTLQQVFTELQTAADVTPPAGKARFGFHDIRRGFATMNADRMTPDALQALMQHKDYQTTQRYISMARQLHPAVENLFVPKIPQPKVV